MTSEDNNNTEPTMGEKPETAQDRLDALKVTVAATKRTKAARDAGFDDLSDYDTWLLLEELRKLTLANRPQCITGTTSINIAPNIDHIKPRLDNLDRRTLSSYYYNGIN
jgi:hypothetical protein